MREIVSKNMLTKRQTSFSLRESVLLTVSFTPMRLKSLLELQASRRISVDLKSFEKSHTKRK